MGYILVAGLLAIAGVLIRREGLGKLSRTLFILAIIFLMIGIIL